VKRLLHVAAVVGWASCAGGSPDARRPRAARSVEPQPAPAAPIVAGALQAPPLVVFAVLDTVRADHTSLCGYDRPTTPALEAIVQRGGVHTCRAYSPAAWTHPSHATFFSGRSVVEHEAVWSTRSDVSINPVTRVRPLDDAFETVAERFQAAGYQTLAVSGNMILQRPSGLLQGFEKVAVADAAYALRGPRLIERLSQELDALDPNQPLFLFINAYDAHDPYPAIPEGVPWLPTQGVENLHPNVHDADHPYVRFVKGLAKPAEAKALLRRVRNGYDWGIHQADAQLGAALELLVERGWTQRGMRVIVTSDHGELLGEHQLLRHGGFVYEGAVRVPLVAYDSTTQMPALPEPASGQWVHDLLLYGQIPSSRPPVHAVAEPNERDVLIGTLAGAVWDGNTKLVCVDGSAGRFDLTADPGELDRQPLAGHKFTAPLKDLCAKIDALHHKPPPADDPAWVEALIAVGYLSKEAGASSPTPSPTSPATPSPDQGSPP
jgi:hypothetical protein